MGEEKAVDTSDNNENCSFSFKKSEEISGSESSKPLNLAKDEDLYPWKYCLATYEENNDISKKTLNKVKLNKKKGEKKKCFECSLCSKTFGWPTDLKRHLLIHTGSIFNFYFTNINSYLFKIILFMNISYKLWMFSKFWFVYFIN